MGNEQRIFYAHSVPDRDKRQWQPLAEHLRSVAEEAGARGAKFGARNAAAFAGLMHDLGKYSLAFQRRLDDASENALRALQHTISGNHGCSNQRVALVQRLAFDTMG